MIRDTFVAFDDVVFGGQSYVTSDTFDARLGAYDQLTVMLEVRDFVEGVPGEHGAVTVGVEHSGDGVHWCTKWLELAQVDTTYVLYTVVGGYDGSKPMLPFVRLRVTVSSQITRAEVCVYAALRDPGEGTRIRRGSNG